MTAKGYNRGTSLGSPVSKVLGPVSGPVSSIDRNPVSDTGLFRHLGAPRVTPETLRLRRPRRTPVSGRERVRDGTSGRPQCHPGSGPSEGLTYQGRGSCPYDGWTGTVETVPRSCKDVSLESVDVVGPRVKDGHYARGRPSCLPGRTRTARVSVDECQKLSGRRRTLSGGEDGVRASGTSRVEGTGI